MKKIIIAFFLAISHVIYGADSITVNQIYFDGLQRIALSTALFNLPLKVGNIINNEIIADSIKILFSTGYFEDIVISHDDNGIVTVTVKERSVINNIKLYGNKTIKSDVIQQILNTKKIQVGEFLDNSMLLKVKRELGDIYCNFGKFDVIVNIDIIPISRNRVNLQIAFVEGKSTKISQINIFGNRAFSEKQLLKKFKLYNRFIRWNTLFNSKYQKQKLFYDLETLRVFYLNHGYAKFHIEDVKVNLTKDKKNVCLSIYITEGMQYSFGSLVILGNVLDYFPKINEYLKINSGELYSYDRVTEIDNNIRYLLGKYGYIKPSISIEYDCDDRKRIMKLFLYIDVGDRFYVREIRFEGNEITMDSVIRREINQVEQFQLNYILFLNDQARLRYVSYLKSIKAHVQPVPGMLNQVDIIYNVEERNNGNLNLSVGFGTESGVNMQLGVYQENFLGTGNSVSITGVKNCYQTYVDFSVLKKYFGINKINISGKLFYNNIETSRMDLSKYDIQNFGINANCSPPFTEHASFMFGFDYISNYLNHIAPQITIWRYLCSVGIEPKIVINDKYLNNNFGFSTNDFLLVSGWIFDDLNQAFFPSSGSRINITGKLTLPGSNNQYYKIIMDSNHYTALNPNSNWVLMSTMHAGYAGSIFKKESPFYDNFYIGGIETIRGFRLNSIGPKAAYYRCNDSDLNYSTCVIENSRDTIGGNAVFFFLNELIVPITYIDNTPFSNMVRISLFMDAGTVWDTHWRNTAETHLANILDYSIFGHIRISSGVSLKWLSPVGPIIFSYSKLIKKFPGDIEEPFQFSIGKAW